MTRVTEWTRELRRTSLPQATEVLCDGHGYCCLGIGEELIGRDGGTLALSRESYASTRFIDWLGADKTTDGMEPDDYGWDLVIDWPKTVWPKNEANRDEITAVMLNDVWGLTFAQIADVVDYFGVETARWNG